MITFLSFCFVIFVIVLIHELGHFTVAKLSGIKVNEFSIGFGPKLFSFKKGETEYVIRPIPLGGFVDLYGMEEEVLKDDNKEWNRSFVSKSAIIRFSTLLAGPFMNYVLAFVVLFSLAFFAGQLEPLFNDAPYIAVAEKINTAEGLKDSKAHNIGFKTGDKIISVNDQNIKDFNQLRKSIENKNTELKIEVNRNNTVIELNMTAKEYNSLEEIGIYQGTIPVIGEITPGQEASNAGILKNDKIIKVNEIDIFLWEQAADIIHKSVDKDITVTVSRKKEEKKFNVTPRDILNNGMGILGIAPKLRFGESMTFGRSVDHAFKSVINMTFMMFDMLEKLITGNVSVKNLTGPVGIASVIGEKARDGINWLFYMLAFISINIGFLNLLPFPALDGGRLVFIFIEMIGTMIFQRKIKISSKIEEMIHYAGLVFLIFLILIVTYRDILRLFKIGVN